MTSEEKKKLAGYLASLDRNERAKLMKRASQLRKSSVKRPARSYIDMEEEDLPIRNRAPGMDDYLWRIVQYETHVASLPTRHAGKTGLVIEVNRKTAVVLVDEETKECFFAPELGSEGKVDVAVGDEGVVETRSDKEFIVAVGQRRTKLSRPDVHVQAKERVIAANIDTVVVVTSIVSPPLHPRIIDRYLIAIQRGGCRAVLAVNKLDLLSGDELEEELAKLRPYEALGVPVIRCAAAKREGMSDLRSCLTGQLSAFVGHSGVGKSSLINSLKPDLNLKVGDVSEGYGRGTHTTTSSSLLDLGDLRVIDTPGIRSFGLWQLRQEDLPWYFPEFSSVGRCKFRDCSHTHEPHCAVKEAVASRSLSRSRYDTYLRILDTL